MVVAMSKDNMNAGIPTIFRSYKGPANQMPDCTIWEALCATTAHPDLFKSIDIGEPGMRESFVGGELGCNNPIGHALAEAKALYPNRRVACIVSIGAGHTRTIHIPEPNPFQRILPTNVIAAMQKILTDSERVAQEMAMRFHGTQDVYFRLSVNQGMQGVGLSDWERLNKVVAHTRAYMRQPEITERVSRLAKAIGDRNGVIATSQIGACGLPCHLFFTSHFSVSDASADGQVHVTAAQQAAGVKHCPMPTLVFTGRDAPIGQVESCILDCSQERRVCVLHGLGGAGKTQIALRTIEKTKDKWSDVVYVDATSRETTESTLKGFAITKGIGSTYEDTIQWLGSHRKQ